MIAFLTRSPITLIAAALLAALVLAAMLGPYISPWDGEQMDFEALEAAPSAAHWFGTDMVGRDLFVRTMRARACR